MPDNEVSAARRLRSLLAEHEPVVAPGCGDALSARLIEEAGYNAAYMSGGWTSMSRGFLDVGLVSVEEMVANARYIARSIGIPLIADIDTGFGTFVNVQRCVFEMEQAGVAAVHIEDQKLPKKCGLVSGKEVVSTGEMAAKLRAAADARDELLLICRTDALEPEGLERTIERGHAYYEAGADMLWVEGIRDEDEAAAVAEAFHDRLLLFSRTPKGYGPQSSLPQIREWGYDLVLLCVHLMLVAMQAQQEFLAEFKALPASDTLERRIYDLHASGQLLGESEAFERQRHYATIERAASVVS
jgi:2-methylisocitrate lyase-like PEP mutase family enzyme